MRTSVLLLVAALAFGVSRVSREAAKRAQAIEATSAPYAPSPAFAPIVFLGYRELGADLLYVRLRGYYGAYDSEPRDSGPVAEAIVTLDPTFRSAYQLGAIALTDARRPPNQEDQLRALNLLERGMKMFPSSYQLPNLAGQIYLVELKTNDPEQRRTWDERGTLLLESASRKPGAPTSLALSAAQLTTKLGKRERAIASLRELFLTTGDQRARADIVAQLEKVMAEDQDDIASEISWERAQFERAWLHERPWVPASFFVLLGAPLGTTFDLTDLATGGQDLIGSQGFERLEPLVDTPMPP